MVMVYKENVMPLNNLNMAATYKKNTPWEEYG